VCGPALAAVTVAVGGVEKQTAAATMPVGCGATGTAGKKPCVTLAGLPGGIGDYTDLQVSSPRICHPLCLIRREIRRSIQVGRSRRG